MTMPSDNVPGLLVWVIYDHPADFPSVYVLRCWRVGSGGCMNTSHIGFGSTVEECRSMVPPGLSRFERAPDDDPVIVESWI